MKLSTLLPELLPQYDFKLENEQEFSTLGLVVAEVKEPFCTFVDTEHALKDLHDGITMVITTPEIAPKLVKQGRGVCITEQPRVVFFRLHNALGQHGGYARARHATRIGKNCSISPLAVIAKENVIIGKLIPAGTGLPEVEEELVQAEIARDAAEAAYDH